MLEINYLAVLVCAVAAIFIGSFWYSPKVFGSLWMEGMGVNQLSPEEKEKMKAAMGWTYFQQFIGSLLTAYVLAHVIAAFFAAGVSSGIGGGLQGGFWIWLGFILPLKYGESLWSGKKFKYVAVDLGGNLITLLVMGAILGAW